MVNWELANTLSTYWTRCTFIFQVLFVVAVLAVVLCNGAVIRPGDDNTHGKRQGRTLGLLQAGTAALGSGIGAVGSAAATAVGVAAGVKPLILLGLGKCEQTLVNSQSVYSFIQPDSSILLFCHNLDEIFDASIILG